jgi:DNA-binding transcriptional regulator YiaG
MGRRPRLTRPPHIAIKELRRQLGLTQTEFAERVGVNQATVSRWEQGFPISRMARKSLERLQQEAA